MDGNAIPISENTTVIVKASGDLFLEGQEQNEVRFYSSEDRIRMNQSNDTLYIETHSSMDLSVPARGKVIVEKVGGSAMLQDVLGSLVVQKVGGDLALRRCGPTRIEKVGGSCTAAEALEGLTVQKIGGDLTIRGVSGVLEIGSIGGSGDLEMVDCLAAAIRAGGDIRLTALETLSGQVALQAGGSITLYLPASANARFVLASSGESISLDLTRQEVVMQEEIESRRFEFKLGDGEARVEVYAGGDVAVRDQARQGRPLAEEMDRREHTWKDSRGRRGNPSWSGGFGFDRSSVWADMISRRAQEAARRAEQRAQAAMRRTEEQLRRAAARSSGDWGGAPPPPPPPPPVEPVTDQERLLVLKMLQEGKLTVEQAEQLLAALEGRSKG